MTALKKIYRFYRHECCFPYTIAFFLVLFIYAIDFGVYDKPRLWPSVVSYFILAGYYIKNTGYYRKNVLGSDDPKFFILMLTFKIILWGLLLIGLFILSL